MWRRYFCERVGAVVRQNKAWKFQFEKLICLLGNPHSIFMIQKPSLWLEIQHSSHNAAITKTATTHNAGITAMMKEEEDAGAAIRDAAGCIHGWQMMLPSITS